MTNKIAFPLLLSASIALSVVRAQTGTLADTLAQVNTQDTTVVAPMLDLPYERISLAASPFAVGQLSAAGFNQGLITDPLLLAQGRLAGVQLYNRGSNPNALAFMQIRGLSAFTQARPLMVVDGLPGAAVENIDPNDIATITILKDGAAQALYGAQAASGVVLITTRSSTAAQAPLTATYHWQAAHSTAHRSIPVMDAAAFRAAGGTDFGAATTWMDEIQQSPLSHTHHLSVGGRKRSTHYRISGSHRYINGVLQRSGFNQSGVRARIGTALFQERLTLDVSAAYTSRNSQFGFPEAFRYAVSANPTMPVAAHQGVPPISNTLYGGFYEGTPFFENTNPKALLTLNQHFGLQQVIQGSALLRYHASPSITFNLRHGRQKLFANDRLFFSPLSVYINRAAFRANVNPRTGFSRLIDTDEQFATSEFFVNYQQTLRTVRLLFTTGATHTGTEASGQHIEVTGLTDPSALDVHRVSDLTQDAILLIRDRPYSKHTEQAVFARTHVAFWGELHLHASVRTERRNFTFQNGVSKGDWTWMPSAGAVWDIGKTFGAPGILRLRTHYGASSQDPMVRKSTFTVVTNPDGSTIVVIGNNGPFLERERKSEVSAGIDFTRGGFTGTLDVFQRSIKNLFTAFPIGSSLPITDDSGQLRTRGAELTVGYQKGNPQKRHWATQLVLASYRTTLQDHYLAVQIVGSIKPPFLSEEIATLLRRGEAVGQIWGPVHAGLDANGDALFEDFDGDGQTVGENGIVGDIDDYRLLGSGIPALELGWHQQLSWGTWSVAVALRSSLGHSLVNEYRHFFENSLSQSNNRVDTRLNVPGLNSSRVSSLFVERADYLKLDHLTTAKTFSVGRQTRRSQVRLALTAQNLLLATRYTGADPEPSLADTTSPALPPSNRALITGIDRAGNYLPARSFVATVGFVW